MKRLLLLLVGIFSIVAVQAQMPHPDVLSSMILKTLEAREACDEYACYTIYFKYDGIVYPASELDAVTVDELVFQLKKRSPHRRFRHAAAPCYREEESLLKFAKRHNIQLPCNVLYIGIELTEGLKTHIYTQSDTLRYNANWEWTPYRINKSERCTWDYNFADSRYEIVDAQPAITENNRDIAECYFESTNLEKSDIIETQQPSEVKCFSDIARHIERTECRCTSVHDSYYDGSVAEMKSIKINLNHFAEQYSRMLDDSGIITYDCDTLYIRSCTYVPTFRTTYEFKCNKGIYAFTDEGLTPCDYSHLQSSEEMFAIYKGYPDAEKDARKRYDYHPFSYESAMAPYTLWDNERLIRNLGNLSDYSNDVIRIIIHDHKVVYFDVWDW
jgi:hypothetical protein